MHGEHYSFYEPRYFRDSPTYKTWVKLFIADVYKLESRDGYEATKARFIKNHPIRWIELVGIVVSITIRTTFCEIEIDDGSGACIALYVKDAAAESINVDFEHNFCSLILTDFVRVRGELALDFKNDLQFVVDTIQKRSHQHEVKAWQVRIDQRKVLETPWKLEPTDVQDVVSIQEKPRRQERIVLRPDETSKHTKRNLRLVLLQHLREQEIQDFTIAQLRTKPEIDEAVSLVAARVLVGEVVSSAGKYRLLNSCLADLVRDGSLIAVDAEKGKYSVVGVWNLGLVITDVVEMMMKEDPGKDISIREVWQRVRQSNTGMDSVSKQMVEKLLKPM